jgi:hypothetical protein
MTVEQLNAIRDACSKFGIKFELAEVGVEDSLFGKRIKINGGFIFPPEVSKEIASAAGEEGGVMFLGSIVIDKKPKIIKDLESSEA